MGVGNFTSPALDGNGLAEIGGILRRQLFPGNGDIIDANFFRQHVRGKVTVGGLPKGDCPPLMAFVGLQR